VWCVCVSGCGGCVQLLRTYCQTHEFQRFLDFFSWFSMCLYTMCVEAKQVVVKCIQCMCVGVDVCDVCGGWWVGVVDVWVGVWMCGWVCGCVGGCVDVQCMMYICGWVCGCAMYDVCVFCLCCLCVIIQCMCVCGVWVNAMCVVCVCGWVDVQNEAGGYL
jgi:hypothetical protein